jgi:antibiotic biosynthesis monooxygenase (ABM) superfamily enzyme
VNATSDTLVIVSIDVEPEYEDEFNRWQEEENIPRLLESPGYLSAVRCEAALGTPRLTSIFEVDPSAAVELPIDQASTFVPDHLASHAQLDVAVYKQIFPEEGVLHGVDWQDQGTPGAILLNRFNVPPEADEEFNAWYNEEHLPMLAEVPGTISDRRFAAIKGKQKYLARYDLVNTDVPTTEAWLKIRYTPWTKWIGRYVRDSWRVLLVPQGEVQFAKHGLAPK